MKLKRFLKKKKMTANKFATIYNFNIKTIYRYLDGRIPHIGMAAKIEIATGGWVTVEEQLGETDD